MLLTCTFAYFMNNIFNFWHYRRPRAVILMRKSYQSFYENVQRWNEICVDDWCICVSFHWFEMPYHLRHNWTISKGKNWCTIEKLDKKEWFKWKILFFDFFFPRFMFPFHLFSKMNFSSFDFVCKKSFQTNSKWRVSEVNPVNLVKWISCVENIRFQVISIKNNWIPQNKGCGSKMSTEQENRE